MHTDEVEKARAEEYLAELPDAEFDALTRRVRPPKSDRHHALKTKKQTPVPASER